MNNNAKVIDFNAKKKDIPQWYKVKDNGSVQFKEGVLAKYLVENIKAFYSSEGSFYFYKNGVYEKYSEEEVLKIIKGYLYNEYIKFNQLTNTYQNWKLEALENVKNINAHPYILNLKNCLIDVKTLKTAEHNSDYKSTIQLNINYNPNLKIEDAKRFQEFLKKSIPDKENQKMAQEMLAYSLLNLPPEKFFILNGQTNTGKSTFLDIIQHILGEENISHIPLQKLGEKFETAHLFNKLANICADLPQDALKDIGVLKQITGGDVVYAQWKGKDGFNFKNKATPIFSCNELPMNQAENSNAFYNRLVLLSFNHRIPNNEVNPNFKVELLEEVDYIFNWALEGIQRLINNGFQITESEESLKLKEKYKKDSDPIALFCEECVQHTKNEDDYIISQELYKNYKIWCADRGYYTKNDAQFGKALNKIFTDIKKSPKRVETKRKNVYIGLKYID